MSDPYYRMPPIEPDIHNWPVYRLSEERPHFVRQLRTSVFQSLTGNGTKPIKAVLERALYMERTRIREHPWRVDPPDEAAFWSKVRKRLANDEVEPSRDIEYAILEEIIHRYAEEIVGTFKINTFLFARRFLTFFFSRLLNTIVDRSIFSRRLKLYDKLKVTGDYEMVRSLMKKGTVIIVPTHSSNLDSILIGYMLDAVIGLPSFSYGAGLNLYNTGYIAYFMNRLGAYRVDRRKKNLIYLETLKAYSRLTIERGVNSIFFPGGTRSRSGQIEPKLKLGLLSTAVEAQRLMFQKDRSEKVFIVPLNVSYHFVLEAGTLINQHLREEGKERFVISSKDDASSIRKIIKFIWKFLSNSSDITFSFSKPLDVLGNPVDADGASYDKMGRPIDIKEYFQLGHNIVEDAQRESQYSKALSEKIVESYYKDYVVLSSHFVSFLAFGMLLNEHKNLDIYGVLRLNPDNYIFDYKSIQSGAEELLTALKILHAQERIKLDDIFQQPIDEILKDGVKNTGIYHAYRPLYFNKKGALKSESLKLLFFYHNRLDGYRLAEKIDWHSLRLQYVEE